MENKPKGLFNETPASHTEDHPANYISYISQRMRRFRLTMNAENRSEKRFGQNVLSKYFGKPIARASIQRAEDARIGTHWGVIAAYLYEMGVFPDIVRILEKGYPPTLHTAMLSRKKLDNAINKASEVAEKNLTVRAKHERKDGVIKR
jgi:hypothetical protein